MQLAKKIKKKMQRRHDSTSLHQPDSLLLYDTRTFKTNILCKSNQSQMMVAHKFLIAFACKSLLHYNSALYKLNVNVSKEQNQ
jgi:hypothetical protein